MTSHLQTADKDRLYNLIQVRTGLILNVHQLSDVSVLLNDLAEELDAKSGSDLFSLLSQSPSTHPLWQRIVHVITVGETYFFRNMAQFNALRTHMLPPIIEERQKSGNKVLRLWSAGSSTGEEAYTLAILLRQMLPDINSWNIQLLATDINETYLQQAQDGLYRPRAFRSETPPDMQARWFAAESDGYRIAPVLRKMVSFELLNLVMDDYPSFENGTMNMDVIFCRNVTIYFDRQTTRQIAQRFHAALNPNGWLVVGHSEPQSEIYQGFAPRNFKDTVIYQKVAPDTTTTPTFHVTQADPVIPKPLSKPIDTKKTTSTVKVTTPAPEIKTPKLTPQVKKPAPEMKNPAPQVKKPTSEAKAAAPAPTEDGWMRAKQAADRRQWKEAHKWLDQAEARDKFRPEVHYLRALIKLEEGDVPHALQLLRQSVYCNVNFSLAHYTLGDIYAQQGSPKEAARHWKLALSAVETMEPKQVLLYSDNLTVEMLVTLLVDRLTGI